MTARKFKNRADWVSVILEAAERELAKDPDSDLYRPTNLNTSGGHEYWGRAADAVYRNPNNLEEGLLALELRAVLEKAASNQLKIVDRIAQSKPIVLNMFGLPMDFGLLISTIEKLAARNPLAALEYKLQASRIASATSGLSLSDFLTKYCLRDGVSGEEFCSNF